jgi:hypothetical protein
MSVAPAPLERRVFEARELMEGYAPHWRHDHKALVYEVACPPGSVWQGRLRYTRWAALPLAEEVDPASAAARVEPREDVYDYAATGDRPAPVEWHVNFADPHLFVAYTGGLFAQDEMQVAEHPALGALREALVRDGHAAVTVEHGRPTPVLVMGVERRCRVATDRNTDEGRSEGLYGNAFARASEDAVRRATTPIDPPTVTNLIAMAAPGFGVGAYSDSQIHSILTTAFTGFRAAVLEAESAHGPAAATVVHTGYWGCGAFGGNRVLMAALQALAAEMAGVRRLVLHTFDRAGSRAWDEARGVLHTLAGRAPVPTAELIARIAAVGFAWGESDGN